MFPFSEIQRHYSFQSENEVFDKLSRVTYRTFGQSLDVGFVCADPQTFELWHAFTIFNTVSFTNNHNQTTNYQAQSS